MAAFAGIVLILLAAPALLVNLYFALLILGRAPRLRGGLAALFNACGAETSTCAVVVRTPYARLFGGVPNVAAGTPWALALLVLAISWIATGRLIVPWPYLAVAAASVVVSVYLVYVLVAVLKQPCPL